MQASRRLLRHNSTELRLLAEAIVALAKASLAIRFLPFSKAVRIGAVPLGRCDADEIDGCLWAVKAAAARVPWKAVCFQQGVAAQGMLRRRGVDAVLHYGIAKDPIDRLLAHVWLEADGRIQLGGEEAAGFRSVATYPEPGCR